MIILRFLRSTIATCQERQSQRLRDIISCNNLSSNKARIYTTKISLHTILLLGEHIFITFFFFFFYTYIFWGNILFLEREKHTRETKHAFFLIFSSFIDFLLFQTMQNLLYHLQSLMPSVIRFAMCYFQVISFESIFAVDPKLP